MKMTPARKKILVVFISLLAGFVMVLFVLGAFSGNPPSNENPQTGQAEEQEESFYGIITYISSSLYPEDEINYSLTDKSGKQLILLKAKDEILLVSEGLDARVYGKVSRTKDGKNEVLLVEKVVINNVSN